MKLSWTLTVETAEGVTATSEVTERDFTPPQLAALEHIIRHRGEMLAAPIEASAGTPAHPVTPSDAIRLRTIAQAQGFTGDICGQCGSSQMKRSGTCLTCQACGSTTGCS